MIALDLGGLWIVGVIAAFPAVRWWATDVSRISRRAWSWSGHRLVPWQWAILLGWISGGWLAIAVIIGWWYAEGGAAVSFGSDAHDGSSVGRGFVEAAAMAEVAGFRPQADPLDFWRR